MRQQFIAQLENYRGGKALTFKRTAAQLTATENPVAAPLFSIRANLALDELSGYIKRDGIANLHIMAALPYETDITQLEGDTYQLDLPEGQLLNIVDGVRRVLVMSELDPAQEFTVTINLTGAIGFVAVGD